MKRLLIKYGDVAIGAREDFSPSSEDKAYFTDFSVFKKNIDFPKYTNPCEFYSTPLDGSCLPLPESPEKANLGWWSEQLSGYDGVFEEPIILTATSTDLYSSIGITIVFDEANDLYSTDVNIKWYRYDELISELDFRPNSSNYFCENKVDFYNKIVITFYSLNMPKNRLKVHGIDYGYDVSFSGEELQGVKAIQEISPLSDEISINTLDFDLLSKRDIEFYFQERQTIETYFNGTLRAKTFIKDFRRKTKTQWSINTEDYIGIMEMVPFLGGIYEEIIAKDLIKSIFDTAKIPYTIQELVFDDITLSGYIAFTNCREALMQVCFAMGAAVDTSNRSDVYVFSLSEDVSQTIELNRIMQGQNFEKETKMTAFELTAHQYTPIETESLLYEAEKSGVGNGIFVKFNEPMHDLSITEGSEIVSSGANHAIINAVDGCVLSGKRYEHQQFIKRKVSPLLLATDTDNVISVTDATLVSSKNVDKLLDRCYNYFSRNQKVNLKIVEAKHTSFGGAVKYGQKKYGTFKYGEIEKTTTYDQPVNVGDLIEVETEYLGKIQGRVIKQIFNLNGGIIIKDTTMR